MQKTASYFLILLALLVMSINTCSAANWVKLGENNTSKLMLDKQSILDQKKLKRAWVKIAYKPVQTSLESPATQYNLSKLLWYFDCSAQKSAAAQVFQYLNADLVHSAAIDDIKNAMFIEPVPESDFDRAMQYVCTSKNNTATRPAVASTTAAKAATAVAPNEKKPDTKPAEAEKKITETAKPATAKPNEKPVIKPSIKKTETSKKVTAWNYNGKDGPDNWGKLSDDFLMCQAGSNQSPINIDESLHANLKPLKLLQKFPAKEVAIINHSIQLDFRDGNIVAIDNTTFKLKQANIHTPGEHSIKSQSFPLEVQFLHTDIKGNTAIVAVLFREGKPNAALDKLIAQLPTESGKAITLKSRILASEMMPSNRDYYRFNGSLTSPPCTEGIRWVLVKTPMTASKEQIDALSTLTDHNNRPLQPTNGRVIVD